MGRLEWEQAMAAVRPLWERRHGADGRRAAHELPARVAKVAAGWGLKVLDPLATGWESVLVAVRDASERPGVLKCRAPADPGTWREAVALTRLSSPSVVALIASLPDEGVLWLGRVVPGYPLSEEPDDQAAVDAFCQVAGSLPRPAVGADPPLGGGPAVAFPSLVHQLDALDALVALDGWRGALPPGGPSLARPLAALADRLVASTRSRAFLHGDLHDENILAAGAGTFCAIDPKGVWGDPAYEPACFLMNRWTRTPASPQLMAATAARLAARLQQDARRVMGWTIVHTALSLAWSHEDDGVPAPASDPRWTLLRQAPHVLREWEA